MASPHELSGGETGSPYLADIETRNTKIGDFYFKEADREFTRQINELWKEHPGLVDLSKLPESSERVAQKAREKAIKDREAGLMNDDRSKLPGIYVTGSADYQGLSVMEEGLRTYNIPYVLNILDINQPYTPYNLHLPQGGFDCYGVHGAITEDEILLVHEHLRVFEEITFHDESDVPIPLGSRAHFLTGGYVGDHKVHGTVGRIEGAGGALWQNPNTNPDGSLRQKIDQAA